MSAAVSVVELGVEDVALILGASRVTAWRFLRDLEAKHGEATVFRRGRKLFTTSAAIAQFIPHPKPPKTPQEVDVENLRAEHRELANRHDLLARDVHDLKRQANEWFRRKM